MRILLTLATLAAAIAIAYGGATLGQRLRLYELTGNFDLCTLPARQTAPAYAGTCGRTD